MCASCGALSARWVGRCASCGAWNAVAERSAADGRNTVPAPTPILSAQIDDGQTMPTGVGELDRVLGGGLVAGSTTLLFGEPGVGKSTLALQAMRSFAMAGSVVVLVAAEESAAQVARRARRLGPVPADLAVVATNDVAAAEQVIERYRPTLVVVDSVSALRDEGIGGSFGSVNQVRAAAERLCAVAKATNTALVLIGHVTKDGELAGPRALEHVVDTVLRIEGDRHGSLRVVRALKHRFGPTGEVGLFEMVADGLRELPDGSLNPPGPGLDVPGVVWSVTNDGSRSLSVEIQALVASSTGSPRRVAHQVSSQRLALLLAVLEARCGVELGGSDVFATTAGGLPAVEPGVDAALALAIASAAVGFVVPANLAVVGEVGLAGELRPVSGLNRRLTEVRRRGVERVIVPAGSAPESATGLDLIVCRRLIDVIEAVQPVTV